MVWFVQGKWFRNLYGLYASITRSCISANDSSELFVYVMKKVFCYQPLVLYCDINHFQWDTKCMICLILNISHSILSAFFQEIHFRFFLKLFFPVHADNFKLIKMIFENGVCKCEFNTYSIQRVFGFSVQRSKVLGYKTSILNGIKHATSTDTKKKPRQSFFVVSKIITFLWFLYQNQMVLPINYFGGHFKHDQWWIIKCFIYISNLLVLECPLNRQFTLVYWNDN